MYEPSEDDTGELFNGFQLYLFNVDCEVPILLSGE